MHTLFKYIAIPVYHGKIQLMIWSQGIFYDQISAQDVETYLLKNISWKVGFLYGDYDTKNKHTQPL